MHQQTNGQAPSLYERAPWQTQEAAQYARFYTHEDYDRAASEREGRPIIRAKPYIEFPRAGEIDVLRREATEGDKQRFPDQWKRYSEAREDIPVGTPISTLFPAHPEIISTLRFFRCHTIEQLAEMSEHGVQKIGLGAFEWRNKARELIKAADGSKGFHQLQKALEDRDATIAKLQAQMAALDVRLSQPTPAADVQGMIRSAVAEAVAAERTQSAGQAAFGLAARSSSTVMPPRRRQTVGEPPAIPEGSASDGNR
jgi:hypothetical protein